jgi:hypothetical protein
MATKKIWTPSNDDIKNAPKDIAWEFAAMLAAALEIAKGSFGPINHQAQEVFLLHVRNLAEFFRGMVGEFEAELKNAHAPPFPRLARELPRDNIYAVDFCSAVLWSPGDFSPHKKLMVAINKTLSHMSYSRTSGIDPFDGKFHVHGTVTLMRRTWDGFLKALRPEFQVALLNGLHEHTREDDLWGLRPLNDFGDCFEKLVNNHAWRLNETPDGYVFPFPYPPAFPYFVNSRT